MQLYKRKDSPLYYVLINLPDKTAIRKSTGETDERKAKRIGLELEAKHLAEFLSQKDKDSQPEDLKNPSATPVTLENSSQETNNQIACINSTEAIAITSDVLQHASKVLAVNLRKILDILLEKKRELVSVSKRSGRTVDYYECKAKTLCSVFGEDYPVNKLDAPAIDEYVSKRRKKGASENTIDKEVSALFLALKSAKRQGLWSGDIDTLKPEDLSKPYEPRERYLSPGELRKLLANLLPDRAARVAFMVATSARLGECNAARREDVTVTDSGVFVYLRGTKTESSARLVPIVAKWQASLLAYALQWAQGEFRESPESKGLLFTDWMRGNYLRDLSLACDDGGIPAVTPNDLRRTCASWLRQQGAPLDLIAKVLGHTTTTMVQLVYGRMSADDISSRLSKTMDSATLCSTQQLTEFKVSFEPRKIVDSTGEIQNELCLDATDCRTLDAPLVGAQSSDGTKVDIGEMKKATDPTNGSHGLAQPSELEVSLSDIGSHSIVPENSNDSARPRGLEPLTFGFEVRRDTNSHLGAEITGRSWDAWPEPRQTRRKFRVKHKI